LFEEPELEATEGLEAALEQLKWVESRLDGAQSLETLRSLYDRVQAVRQSFPADFNLQMSAADLQERLVERGRRLRAGALRPSSVADPATRPTEEAEQVLGPPLPPNVVVMDPRNWKRAVYAGAFFAILLFAAFFYLIQMARQLNQMSESSATKQSSEAKPPAATAPTPPPVTPTLRLYTDLVPGKVSVDGANDVELQDGELTLEKLAEGHHQVRLTGPSGNASFEFEVQAKHSPQLAGAPSADNAMIVAVSAQGGDGQLATNAIPAQVVLDGKVAGDVGQDGLHLSALGTSDHDLEIRRPHDQQRFILTYTSAPVLTVFVKSDPNAGSLLVITGEDDAEVLINGKRYGHLTQHGALRIPSLKVGNYTVSVIKSGFLDAPPFVVQVSQGVESRAEFHLIPVPQVGTLQITGAQPGTTVFLDGDLLATIGADGNAMVPSIKSGEHGIDLRREGSVTKHFTRSFLTGQVVVLSGTDVTLEKAPPPELRPAPPSGADTAASKAPAPEAKEVVTLAAGERIQSGGGYVSFHITKTQGQYSFWARLHKGGHLLHRDRLQWFAGYQDEKNVVLFQVDGKHLVVRDILDGKGTDKRRIPFEADPHQWVQVEMTVTATGVAVRVRQPGETWVDAGSLPSEGRDFTQGRMGFLVSGGEEIGVRNFQFVK
jgi:hypothetical protein